MNPLAFSFRSSPRTSALAVGERETALVSPPCGHRAHTYTHTLFSQRPGTTWTPPSLFPGFSLWSLEPQYSPPDHPDGAGSKTIGRKPITHTKVLPFPVLLRVLRTLDTPHTYVHSLSISLLLLRLPRTADTLLVVRLFDYPFSESWCTELWNPASDFLEFTLFRFDELTLIR